jgi:hypothetical protein
MNEVLSANKNQSEQRKRRTITFIEKFFGRFRLIEMKLTKEFVPPPP